jgi:hypothetical protein
MLALPHHSSHTRRMPDPLVVNAVASSHVTPLRGANIDHASASSERFGASTDTHNMLLWDGAGVLIVGLSHWYHHEFACLRLQMLTFYVRTFAIGRSTGSSWIKYVIALVALRLNMYRTVTSDVYAFAIGTSAGR